MLIAAGLLWVLIQLQDQSPDTRLLDGKAQSQTSCYTLAAGLRRFKQLRGTTDQQTAQAVIDISLRDQGGVEGGFWTAQEGVTSYAYPTYDGTGVKVDPPSAELARISATAGRAADSQSLVLDVRPGTRETIVFSACPVEGDDAPRQVAWTLLRVPTAFERAGSPLTFVVGGLLAFLLLSAVFLLWKLWCWAAALKVLMASLEETNSVDADTGSIIAPLTGVALLDDIARMLNDYAQRLHRAHQGSVRLASELAQAERLATIGHLSAGLAHEIRNPLGTIRIKVENALAAPADISVQRTRSALDTVLDQCHRLEGLISSLLALTQPSLLACEDVILGPWLKSFCAFYAERAEQRAVEIRLNMSAELSSSQAAPVSFDPALIRRALDNLMLNAFAHLGTGKSIEVGAVIREKRLLLWVADDGEGVEPSLRDRLFTPFVSHRAGGSGLGLAFVQEAARAHGGEARLTSSVIGARFEMEIAQ